MNPCCKNRTTPAVQLLNHLRSTAKRSREHADKWKHGCLNQYGPRNATAAKWESWRDALEALIERDQARADQED